MELLKTFLRRLKNVSGVCSHILANIWIEEILLNKNLPKNLKITDVTPIFKRKIKLLMKITDQ